jgi:hypothetical protein
MWLGDLSWMRFAAFDIFNRDINVHLRPR